VTSRALMLCFLDTLGGTFDQNRIENKRINVAFSRLNIILISIATEQLRLAKQKLQKCIDEGKCIDVSSRRKYKDNRTKTKKVLEKT
jgi:hypothetical protein